MKKAQISGITVLFMYIAFMIFGAMGLFKWLNDECQRAIVVGSLTGIEAFFIANMVLWVIIAVHLALVLGVMFGAR